jgi:hypothetical protein
MLDIIPATIVTFVRFVAKHWKPTQLNYAVYPKGRPEDTWGHGAEEDTWA